MLKRTNLQLETPPGFSLQKVVQSHGWSQLMPFRWKPAEHSESPTGNGVLSRPEKLPSDLVDVRLRERVSCQMPAGVHLEIWHVDDLNEEDMAELRRRSARILGLRDDLEGFHRLCGGLPGFERVVSENLGRLLRSSTLFEDLIKTLMTTNVNWAGTRRMVRRLVDALGSPLPWDDSQKTFPSVRQIIDKREIVLSDLGLGYRAAYVIDLAEKIEAGNVDLSRWESGELSTDALYRELSALKGFGDYAASSMLMLLGRWERIPVDSWARKLITTHFFEGADVTDAQLREVFSEFGSYRGLAYWFYDWKREEG